MKRYIINNSINIFKSLKVKAGKLIRHSIAHQRCPGIQGLRNEHEWEASLLNEGNSDFIEIFDKNYLKHKDFYLNYIQKWTSEYGEALSLLFDRLSAFSLERLDIK